MAAVLATALSLGSAVAARSVAVTTLARPRPRRTACRWVLDPVSGQLVCAWDSDEESGQRPILHLWLVRT